MENLFMKTKTYSFLNFFIGNLAGRTECIYLNDEILRNLSKESPVPTRVRLLKDLCVKVSNSRLENVSIVPADPQKLIK